MITGSLVAAVIIPDRMADHVGGAAGRQRRHDLDRPRRPILRPDAGQARYQQCDGEKPATRT